MIVPSSKGAFQLARLNSGLCRFLALEERNSRKPWRWLECQLVGYWGKSSTNHTVCLQSHHYIVETGMPELYVQRCQYDYCPNRCEYGVHQRLSHSTLSISPYRYVSTSGPDIRALISSMVDLLVHTSNMNVMPTAPANIAFEASTARFVAIFGNKIARIAMTRNMKSAKSDSMTVSACGHTLPTPPSRSMPFLALFH